MRKSFFKKSIECFCFNHFVLNIFLSLQADLFNRHYRKVCMFKLLQNAEQLIYPMCAGVVFANGGEGVICLRLGQIAVVEQRVQMALHFLAILRHQIIAPGLNNPSLSRQGADTMGMPQAMASNGRMVGIPGRLAA